MREKPTLEAFLGDFRPVEGKNDQGQKGRRCVTIWLTPEDKARYDRLQEMSKGTGRKFSDVARKTLQALIDLAEQRAS